jgi:hypothetical protein
MVGQVFPHIFVWGSCFWFCILPGLPASWPPGLPASSSALSHTTLSYTLFHTQLCHTQLFHTQLRHTHDLLHTTLSHTHSFVTDTQLCHTHSFANNFVTHTGTLSHTTLLHATLPHTHTRTHLCHTHIQLFHTQSVLKCLHTEHFTATTGLNCNWGANVSSEPVQVDICPKSKNLKRAQRNTEKNHSRAGHCDRNGPIRGKFAQLGSVGCVG